MSSIKLDMAEATTFPALYLAASRRPAQNNLHLGAVDSSAYVRITNILHIDKDTSSPSFGHLKGVDKVQQSPPADKVALQDTHTHTHLFLYQVEGRQGHQVDLTAQLQGGLGGTHLTVEEGMQNQDL